MWPISVLISGQQGNKLHYSNDFLSTSSHVDGVTAQQKMQTAVGDFPFSCSAGSDLVVQRNSGQITSYSYCSFISCERVKGKICKGALDHHFDTIYWKKKKQTPNQHTSFVSAAHKSTCCYCNGSALWEKCFSSLKCECAWRSQFLGRPVGVGKQQVCLLTPSLGYFCCCFLFFCLF